MTEVFLVRTEALNDPELEAMAGRLVDSERLNKTAHLKQQGDRLRSLACGLLLQYGMERLPDRGGIIAASGWTCLTMQELLGGITHRRDFQFHYGKWGKPYIAGGPYFSMSHSGEYAACAISGEEIGLDIQQMREISFERLGQRFFGSREREALLACERAERCKLFYRLWTRKEAYGKYTGRGLADSLGRSLTDGLGRGLADSLGRSLTDGLERGLADNRESSLGTGGTEQEAVCFSEYDRLPGYQACVCLKA